MKEKVLIIGPNGAGKGTLLDGFMKGREERYQILSMSGILSNVKHNDPVLGAQIDKIMKAGELVPDEIILNLLIKEINGVHDKTVIMDGCIRTLAQAEAIVHAGLTPDAVVVVHAEDEKIFERAEDRLVCSKCRKVYTKSNFRPAKVEGICDVCGAQLVKRPDDERKKVQKRLNQYKRETIPAIEYLKNNGAIIFTIFNNTTPDFAQECFTDIVGMF